MKGADNGGGMNVRDIVLDAAEPLDILAQGLALLLRDDMQITLLARSLMAASEGTDKLMAQVGPRIDRILGQVHQP